MISHAVLTAMLPEHLLLLGIVLLLCLEIAGRWQRASLAVALACVGGCCAGCGPASRSTAMPPRRSRGTSRSTRPA